MAPGVASAAKDCSSAMGVARAEAATATAALHPPPPLPRWPRNRGVDSFGVTPREPGSRVGAASSAKDTLARLPLSIVSSVATVEEDAAAVARENIVRRELLSAGVATAAAVRFPAFLPPAFARGAAALLPPLLLLLLLLFAAAATIVSLDVARSSLLRFGTGTPAICADGAAVDWLGSPPIAADDVSGDARPRLGAFCALSEVSPGEPRAALASRKESASASASSGSFEDERALRTRVVRRARLAIWARYRW